MMITQKLQFLEFLKEQLLQGLMTKETADKLTKEVVSGKYDHILDTPGGVYG